MVNWESMSEPKLAPIVKDKLYFLYGLRVFRLTKNTLTDMATEENIRYCNMGKNIETGSEYEWVSLSLTTVEYPKGDLLGKFLAFASLLPFSIISGFIALIIFRRDLHTISFFIGTMFNEIINLILKHIFCEARPLARNSLYTEYGMPSSHSQFMWFFTTYVVYFIFIRLQHMNNKTSLKTSWRAIITIVCLLAASIVSYSRIYLQYHSWNQVFMGILVGIIFATTWFAATFVIFTPLYPTIASWKISEYLLLRDTTLIPNVLWFEYTNSRQEARARARKLVSMKSQ